MDLTSFIHDIGEERERCRLFIDLHILQSESSEIQGRKGLFYLRKMSKEVTLMHRNKFLVLNT